MALYYQPVGLPSVGSGSRSVSQAALSIGAGLDRLGQKITGLGDRRQRRLDEAEAQKNARGLEILELAAANATSEAELDEIAGSLGLLPGGTAEDAVVVPGSAAAINAARSRILGDNTSRAEGRRQNALFEQEQLKLDDANLEDRFQRENADLLTRIQLGSQRGEDVSALENQLRERASGEFGADLVNKALEGSLNAFDAGQKSRFTVADNAQDLEAGAVDIATDRFALAESRLAASRREEERTSTKKIEAAVARAQTTGSSVGNQLDQINDNPDLTPAERVRAIQAIQAGPDLDATNRIRDDITPLDPAAQFDPLTNTARSLSNAFLGTDLAVNQTSRIPTGVVADGIVSKTNEIIRTEPNLAIFNTALELDAQEDLVGFADDIGIEVARRYPDYDISKGEQQLIKDVATQYNLSPGQTIALVGRSIDNTTLIGQSPELHNSRFKENAKAFAAAKDDVEREYRRLQDGGVRATTMEAQITEKRRELARLQQSPNPDSDRIQKLNDDISTLTVRLQRLEGELETRSGSAGR